MFLEELIAAARAHISPKELEVVIYHDRCNDGSGAALAAYMDRFESLTYIPLAYNGKIDLEQFRGKKVMLVDVILPNPELQKLREIADKIIVLDHHETAQRANADAKDCFFSMDNSGAVLAWRYFHGFEKSMPRIFTLIEDRDLWLWRQRPVSEPLFYALSEIFPEPDFRKLQKYVEYGELNKLLKFGQTLVQDNKAWCTEQAKKASMHIYESKELGRKCNVLCIELENSRLISELAEHLYTNNDIDFVMLWFKRDGKFKLSLRTNKDDVNVATIAQSLAYGGGGHPKAAGAELESTPLNLLLPIQSGKTNWPRITG